MIWLPARALDNARNATVALVAVVTDRLALTERIATDVAEPGHLRLLNREESYEILRSAPVGRLAYIARQGVPDVVPVNFLLDGADVLIRSGPGPKLQAAERRELVAFEVDVIDVDTRSGRSVVVHGRASVCSQAEQRTFADRSETTAWAAGPRHHLIRIRPSRVTGRVLFSA